MHKNPAAPQVPDHFKDRLRTMPKLELHVHIEGAANASTDPDFVVKISFSMLIIHVFKILEALEKQMHETCFFVCAQ